MVCRVSVLTGPRGAGLVGEVGEPLGEAADPGARAGLAVGPMDAATTDTAAAFRRELPPTLREAMCKHVAKQMYS